VAHGMRLIEIDFMPTSDGEIVLTHVWQNMPNRIPGAPDHIVSYEAFMSFRLFNRYTPMDLSMLIAFLDEHPDVRIITDTKDGYDAYTALYAIAAEYPDYIDRFIPQAYRFEHVTRIRALGFSDVIVTLYQMPEEFFENPAEIVRLALEHEVYAITIQEYGITPEFATELQTDRIRYFAHTVNAAERAAELLDMGFYGIYTNFLVYDDTAAPVPARGPQTDLQIQQMQRNWEDLGDAGPMMRYDTRPLLFRLDTPVYFRVHDPQPVSHLGPTIPFDSGIVSPIVKHDSGVLYLPSIICF